MTDQNTASNARILAHLSEKDRDRLGEVLRRLLAFGSILGFEPGETDIYHWAYLNRALVEELAATLSFKLFWDQQDRIVQAVPQESKFLLRLRLDATLVLLTLWYEFDT